MYKPTTELNDTTQLYRAPFEFRIIFSLATHQLIANFQLGCKEEEKKKTLK